MVPELKTSEPVFMILLFFFPFPGLETAVSSRNYIHVQDKIKGKGMHPLAHTSKPRAQCWDLGKREFGSKPGK